jgi:molybdopterin-binding protein
MTITKSVLHLTDVSLAFGDFSLQNVDLEIREGEYFVLLGPTGAGKTVLLETIAGITPVDSGSIFLDGRDITHEPPELRQVGFVYQDYAIFPHLSVRENIAYGLRSQRGWYVKDHDLPHGSGILGMIRRSINKSGQFNQAMMEKVGDFSALLRIDHLLDRSPDKLSGGEKQRVAMARALITDPRILLLDEPLSSLDPETREGIQLELRRMHREMGTTTLHITHDFEVAASLADRIGLIMEGKIVQIGTTREIFKQPINEEVARFVGVRNIFRGNHAAGDDGCGYLQLEGFQLASISRKNGKVRATIRPEDILLSRDPLASSARNNFSGKVVQISDRGSVSYITVRIPPPKKGGRGLDLIVLVTQSSVQELELEPGQEVTAAFKASALHIF